MNLSESIDRIVAEERSVLERFYKVYLERFPEARPFFEGIHLHSQAAMLAVSLAAIRMYPNFPNSTQTYFRVLGRRHGRLGIPKSLYEHFTSTILDVVSEFHGDDWNETLSEQWSSALERVVELMIAGERD